MKLLLPLIFMLSSSALAKPRNPISPDVLAAIQKAGLTGPVQASCTAHFFSPSASAIVVAIETAPNKGSYFVLHGVGAQELSAYSGGADLQCMTPKEVMSMNSSIKESGDAGIHGQAEQNDGLDIVCGFVENTEAVCWGYDKKKKGVVKKGGWTT